MANYVLFHVADVRTALPEVRRVPKPGGRAISSTPGAPSAARLAGLHRQAAASVCVWPARLWSTPCDAAYGAEFQSTFMADDDAGFGQFAKCTRHLRVEARCRRGSHVGAREPALRVTALQVLVNRWPPRVRSETLLAIDLEQLAVCEVFNEIERLIVSHWTVALDGWQDALPN